MAGNNSNSLTCQLRWMLSTEHASEMSDCQLLDRYVNGQDDIAFAALVRRHGPLVLGVCQRVLHHVQDSEDVFQATFLILARKAVSVSRGESVGSWLYKTAFRLAVKLRLRGRRQRAVEDHAAQPQPDDPVADVSWREVQTILDEELARLPPKNRAPLLLCCFEGRTLEEAARYLGWPPRTLQARLARARSLLRGRLARRGLPMGSALAGTLLAGQGALAHVPAPVAVSTCQAAAMNAIGDSWFGICSQSVTTLVQGALKEMVIGNLLKAATVMVLCTTVLGGSIGFLLSRGAPAAGDAGTPALPLAVAKNGQPQINDAKTKQLSSSYAPRNRTAVELAGILGKHFHDAKDVHIAADGLQNTLTLTASPALLNELKNALELLDGKPRAVNVRILLIRMPETGAGAFDVQQLSGPAEGVLDTVDACLKKGTFSSVERLQLTAVEHQAAKDESGRQMPYTTGAFVTAGGNNAQGGGSIQRTVAYMKVGTSFTVIAQAGPGQVIALDLRGQAMTANESADVALLSIEKGESVKATEFRTMFIDCKLNVANGQAVIAKEMQSRSGTTGERYFIVVTAQLVP